MALPPAAHDRGMVSLFESPAMADVTRILSRIEGGDPKAAEQLLPLVYEELRRLAAAKMAQFAPHGVLVESHDLSPLGLPVLPVDSSFTHAIAPTPAGPVEDRRSFLFLSTSGGLPCRCIRSAPALSVSRIAQRSLTLWPVCLLTPQGSLFQECFSPLVTSVNRSRCYRLERPVTGRVSHPLESTCLFTAH